jgi:hypothetical protein
MAGCAALHPPYELRLLDRHLRTRAGLMVGNRYEIVGAAKEGVQLQVEVLLLLRQPPQLVPDAAMPLDDPAVRSKISACAACSRASRLPIAPLDQKLPRLPQKRSGFRLHKSMPPVRISCISGMRSS